VSCLKTLKNDKFILVMKDKEKDVPSIDSQTNLQKFGKQFPKTFIIKKQVPWLIFLLSILINFLLVKTALKSRKLIVSLEDQIENKSKITNTNSLSKEDSYSKYKRELTYSPSGKYILVLEYLADFKNNCQGRANLHKGTKGPLSYMENDGWAGNYIFKCNYTGYSGGFSSSQWSSTFSGWAKDEDAFLVVYEQPVGVNNVLFAYNDSDLWKVRGYRIEGKIVLISDNLNYLLAEKIEKENDESKENVTWNLYDNFGNVLVNKTIETVYSIRYQKLKGLNKFFALVPVSESISDPNKQEIEFYLIDPQGGEFARIGSAGRTLMPGPPCRELQVDVSSTEIITVSGECLDRPATLNIN
jgi:hypothetical protein